MIFILVVLLRVVKLLFWVMIGSVCDVVMVVIYRLLICIW